MGCGCGKRSTRIGALAARTSPAPEQWDDVARQRNLGAIHPSGSVSPQAFAESGDDAVDAIAELLPPDEYPRIMDFGAGVGRVTLGMTERYDDVVAVDAAPQMVKAGKARAPRAEWITDDGLDLPTILDGRPVDAIVALAVFPHMPYNGSRRVLIELAKVLRPGGALALQQPIYDVARKPRDWIDVAVWTLDLLRVTADQAGLEIEAVHTNPGAFAYDAIGPNHGRLHLLRRPL